MVCIHFFFPPRFPFRADQTPIPGILSSWKTGKGVACLLILRHHVGTVDKCTINLAKRFETDAALVVNSILQNTELRETAKLDGIDCPTSAAFALPLSWY